MLDDGHDEGSETMTLRLQSPSPTRVKLANASATGTINNTDPMPRAWITRFGRTVGGQVVDALTGRLEGGDAMHVAVEESALQVAGRWKRMRQLAHSASRNGASGTASTMRHGP